MHPDEMQVWLDMYTALPPAEWRRRGIRLYVHRYEVVAVRYMPSGHPISSDTLDLFWEDWEHAQALITGMVENMLKKPSERAAVGGDSLKLTPGTWEAAYPTLADYLLTDRWDDGSPRDQGSLLIFPQDGVVKGLLKDPNTEQVLWLSGRNLEELFTGFEAALSSGRAEWRVDKGSQRKGAKRPGRLS